MDLILKKAITATVEYGKKFGVAYTKEEIGNRLISDKRFSDKKLEKALENYSIPLNLHLNQEILKTRNEKMEKGKKLAKMLGERFGDILMIGVTGSVAAGYPKENDDIDFIIITQKNRLWLTRLRMRLFIARQKIPHRKYGLAAKGDEFCFNLWLDAGSLELPAAKQYLKNAMDLILMKPIWNRESSYQKFIQTNSWAKKFVARGYGEKIKNKQYLDFKKEQKDLMGMIINWLMFWPQYLYMKKKMRHEIVGLHWAFFHEKGNSDRISA